MWDNQVKCLKTRAKGNKLDQILQRELFIFTLYLLPWDDPVPDSGNECVDITDRPAAEIDFQCSMFYDVEPQ